MMKKYIKIAAFVLTGALLAACGNKQQTEVTTSNNLFSTLLGKSDAEVQARIDSIWTHFFTPGDISKYDADGEKCVYYEVGDSMGIIVDTGSNDVRTEGMSYGMMISLQLDKREVFDKLWRWAKTYMAYPADSPWDLAVKDAHLLDAEKFGFVQILVNDVQGFLGTLATHI